MTKKDIFTGLLIAFALAVFLNQDFFFKTLPTKFLGAHRYKTETLKIVLSNEATDLSPYSLNLNNLIRTGNLYQGLDSIWIGSSYGRADGQTISD